MAGKTLDVNIRLADYFLSQFCELACPLLRWVGGWETRFLRTELASVEIDRPVFITGLARSGTTLLLELLSTIDGVATHRYRDFPFLMTPYLWNRYLGSFPPEEQPVERAHQDRLQVTRESPEAMEEPLWRAFFPHLHSATNSHQLSAAVTNPAFEQFYRDHIRKILFIRRGRRYVAKGNYHIPRLEYLAHLLPDARFIIPVRHPVTHVHSLVRQHQLFSEYSVANPRVPRYLAAAGHFEFGPQRKPICLQEAQGDRILDAWKRGEDFLAYAIQWAVIYGFVEALRADPDLNTRIRVVRYEDLCAEPTATLRNVLHAAALDEQLSNRTIIRLDSVSKSPHVPIMEPKLLESLATEVDEIATAYGYDLNDYH